jgi:polyhydroxyalkanoate synthesis regulator phasin
MILEEILEEVKNKKNLPNKKIVEIMDSLTEEYEMTKKNIISLTYHFDKIEEAYNSLLDEYQSRVK